MRTISKPAARPSAAFLGRPLAIMPTALAAIEEILAAGPSAAVRGAATPVYPTAPGVRLIALDGPIITGLPEWAFEYIRAVDPYRLTAEIRAAASDPDVGGILLYVNSPGGTTFGVDEAADALREAAAAKPVVTYAPDLMASAAAWIGLQARTVVTSRTGLVGSIGTYMRWADTSAAFEQMGMTVHVYRSAPGKAPGQPGEPHNEQVDETLSTLVDHTNAVFLAAVAAGRGVSVEHVQERWATGRAWVGEHAVSVGLADRIGTLAEALALAGESPPGPRPAPAPRPAARPSPARAETHAPGGTVTPEQLALLGLSADATPEQIEAALRRAQTAVSAQAATGTRIVQALALAEGETTPADPLAALSAQAADGRAYRAALLDELHALTIALEGNDEGGRAAADNARDVYASQPLARIQAQVARLKAKRDDLPAGRLSKDGAAPARKPLAPSAYGLTRR